MAKHALMYNAGPEAMEQFDYETVDKAKEALQKEVLRQHGTNVRWRVRIPTEDTDPKAFYGSSDSVSDDATAADAAPPPGTNPKTLMGNLKVPILSVIPPASLIYQGVAMRYGAYLAPQVNGKRGYGAYNWRDQPVEIETYIDAAIRHLMQYQDGDEVECIYDDNGDLLCEVPHLAFALATIGVLIDAIENDTAIDNRPKVRKHVATKLLNSFKMRSSK
jgi:hypothetical protein